MRKPNLLFVFSDQHRACDLNCYGNADVHTPELDRFAAQGVRFTNAVSNCPLCVPIRGSLMTGLYPWHHRAITNDLPVRTDAESIATVLNRAGYHTGYIGKWHLGGIPRDKAIPRHERLGFTEWKAYNCNHSYSKGFYFDENDVRHDMKEHSCIAETSLAAKFIERNSGKPWALTLSWEPPHDPYFDVPEKYLSLYHDKPITLRPNVGESALHHKNKTFIRAEIAERLRGYYALITLIDDQFGRLIDTLKRTGQYENTIVVYTSDHGDMHGSHGFTNKQLPYAESVNVPLIVSWPGHTRSGVTDEVIGLTDLPVSMLGLMGISFPGKVDGENLSALFTDTAARGADGAIICDLVPCHQAEDRGADAWIGVKTKSHTYVRDAQQATMLFDDAADPYQMKNLIDDDAAADIRRDMEKMLSSLTAKHGIRFRAWREYIIEEGYRDAWNDSQLYFKRAVL
ncbi:MAG: sulfatase [Spirochaetes bacterium]|nr:sulfatase [Spirochaetota bacterium]